MSRPLATNLAVQQLQPLTSRHIRGGPLRQHVKQRTLLRIAASTGNGATQEAGMSFDHILIALMDSNPHLSSASRSAIQTAAALATSNASKLTVLFMDAEGQKVDSNRVRSVQESLLAHTHLDDSRLKFVEEEVDASSVGKGSVAVGEVVDSVGADLLVLPSQAIHEKRIDGNLLAEFVSVPVLLLP